MDKIVKYMLIGGLLFGVATGLAKMMMVGAYIAALGLVVIILSFFVSRIAYTGNKVGSEQVGDVEISYYQEWDESSKETILSSGNTVRTIGLILLGFGVVAMICASIVTTIVLEIFP